MISERNLEDPSALLNRIKRAWRRVKGEDSTYVIPDSEEKIIRDRLIKSLKNSDLRTRLRQWNTPLKSMIEVIRDYNNAIKIENEAQTGPSGLRNSVLFTHDTCSKCGLGHDSLACRSNKSLQTRFNKKQRSNKPVTRGQVRIIPEKIGSNNQYQPVQRFRPRSKSPYGRSLDYGRPKRVSYNLPDQRSDGRPPWKRSSGNFKPRWQSGNNVSQKRYSKPYGNSKSYSRSKPFSKYTDQKSTMAECEEAFDHPFQSAVEGSSCTQYN